MNKSDIENRTEDCKFWLNAVSVQLDRIRISFAENLTLVRLGERKKKSVESPYLTEYSKSSAQLWADIHFLYISLNHLRIAINRRGVRQEIKELAFDEQTAEIAENLRHIFEHWDKTKVAFERDLNKKEAAKWYDENHPNKTPWSLSLDANGFIISGVLDVNKLQSVVTALENKFFKIGEEESYD